MINIEWINDIKFFWIQKTVKCQFYPWKSLIMAESTKEEFLGQYL